MRRPPPSLSQIQQVLQSVGEGIHVLDSEGLIIFENPAAANRFGWGVEEMLGRPAHELVHHHRPDGSPYPVELCPIHQTLRDGQPRRVENEVFFGRDGQSFPVDYLCSPMLDDSGVITGVVVSFRDVTERKRAQDTIGNRELQQRALAHELKQERERLLAAQAVAKVGSWETDLATMNVVWSEETHRIFETDPARFNPTHDDFLQIVHPDDRERVHAIFVHSLGSLVPCSIEHRLLLSGARIKHVEERWQAFTDGAGVPRRVVGTCQDITERKLAEEAIGEQRSWLTSAQRIGRMGTWSLDLGSGRLVWSESTCDLFGIRPEQFLGTMEHFRSFVLREDLAKIDTALSRVTAPEGLLEAEYRITRPDGEVRWMYERGTVQFDATGKQVRRLGMVMDITERKRDERISALESEALRSISAGRPLADILHAMVRGVEDLIAGALVTILLLDSDGVNLRLAAAPSLPPTYAAIFDNGVAIGALVGSCGTAAHRREAVIVTDIETDPLWVDHRKAALANGLRACWSTPVLDAAGTVLATFAIYHRQVRTPSARDLELIERMSGLVGIAVERDRKDKDLRLLATCVSRLHDIVLVTDGDLDEPGPRIVFVNPAFERVTGYPSAEVLGRTPRMLQGPDTDRAELDRLRAALMKNEPVHSELINYAKDGTTYWLELDIVPLFDASGVVSHFVAVERDISERKRAEEASLRQSVELKRANERLALNQALLNMASRVSRMGAWKVELPSLELTWSEETAAIHGEPPGFSPDVDKAIAYYAPEFRDQISSEFGACIQQGTPFDVESEIISAQGKRVWVRAMGEAVRDDGGRISRVQGAFQDISTLKRAEEALRTSETRLRNAQRIASLGDWEYDLIADRLTWSQECFRIIGGVEQDFVSTYTGWRKYVHPGDTERLARILDATVREGTLIDVEHRIVRPDGQVRHVHQLGEVAYGSDGRANRISGTIQDITERKLAEATLAQTTRALETLSRCNEALIRSESEDELLAAVCRITVDVGGFGLAWVGYAQDDAIKRFEPRAYAGEQSAYLNHVEVSWSEDHPLGQGPAGRAIRSGEPVIVPDLDADPSFAPWLATARAHGFRGVVCLPLKSQTRVFGALVLYLPEVRTPMADELRLLRELADDMAFGIGNLRAHDERRRTHEAVLAIARGVSASSGVGFFDMLTLSMVEALGAHSAFVVALNVDRTYGATLCAVVDGKLKPGFEFREADAVWSRADRADLRVESRNAWKQNPDAPLLQEFGIEAFVSAKLVDSDGVRVGLIFVLFQQPLVQSDFVSSSLKIFGARAASEIERQKADARLREQASLLDKAQDAIVLRDLEHRVIYWNRSAERLYGYTAQQAIGRTVLELLYRSPAQFLAANQAAIDKGEWVGEIEQWTKGGSKVTVEGRWTLVRDEQGNPRSVLSINTDITERKKLEAQFLRSQRMEGIGTLAGGIAHDLNNTLSPIMMSLELLKTAHSDPETQEVLQELEASAQRGADLVKQVLSFARGVEGLRVVVNPVTLMTDIQKIVRETFPKSIVFDLAPTNDLWNVTGDPTQIHQVFLNLFVNARDAMPAGGRLAVSLENVVLDETYTAMNPGARPGPFVAIQIADSGTGIPPDIRDKIFEPFFTTKEIGKGTGLGLSTTLAIVKSHGGFIDLYSELGKGTRFKVLLPASSSEVAPKRSPVAPSGPPRGHGELVLVADDEEAIRKVAKRTLERFGYRVLLAANGQDAVALYQQHQREIAVVLTDMTMPIMDGPSLIAALRTINAEVRVIAFSGLTPNAAEMGVRYFVAKPYTAEALLSTLRAALDEKS